MHACSLLYYRASNRPQFDLDVAYRTGDGHYRFTLRENQYRACDFEGFGIWCHIFSVHFATITWNNTDIFVRYFSLLIMNMSNLRMYV